MFGGHISKRCRTKFSRVQTPLGRASSASSLGAGLGRAPTRHDPFLRSLGTPVAGRIHLCRCVCGRFPVSRCRSSIACLGIATADGLSIHFQCVSPRGVVRTPRLLVALLVDALLLWLARKQHRYIYRSTESAPVSLDGTVRWIGARLTVTCWSDEWQDTGPPYATYYFSVYTNMSAYGGTSDPLRDVTLSSGFDHTSGAIGESSVSQ